MGTTTRSTTPLRRAILPLGAAVILLVLPYLPLQNFTFRLASEVLIMGLAAAALALVVGHGGLVSLGHGLFFGLGGYAAGIIAIRLTGGDVVAAILAGAGVSALVAAVLGLLVLRTSGLYFMMLTVAVNQLFYILADKWSSVTGGTDGLTGIPLFHLFGMELTSPARVLQVVVFVTIIGVASLLLFTRSRQGLMLNGTRMNDLRMSAIGYSTTFIRYRAMVVSAAVAGAAGALFPVLNGFVGPEQIGFAMSAELLVMVIIGGAVSYYGAFAGAAILVVAQSYLSILTTYWLGAVGVLVLVISLVAPNGLAGVVGRRRTLKEAEA